MLSLGRGLKTYGINDRNMATDAILAEFEMKAGNAIRSVLLAVVQ